MTALVARILTCPDRVDSFRETIAQFRSSDWGTDPVVYLNNDRAGSRVDRINSNWRRALGATVRDGVVSLIVEDDITINAHLRHNLERWAPISRRAFFGSLYNGSACRAVDSCLADAHRMWGSQAIVVSPVMARHILAHWNEEDGFADTRMPRLAARLGPIYCHAPSLVQHIGAESTWGGTFHQTLDFDDDWRA